MSARVLVLNGPNLDRLGTRQPEIYGRTTLADLEAMLVARGAQVGVEVECRQTADLSTLVSWIHGADAQAIVLNPAAFTHYAAALRDAVAACPIPVFEVHISNIYAREPYRRHSLISGAARGTIIGLGIRGYLAALDAAAATIEETR